MYNDGQCKNRPSLLAQAPKRCYELLSKSIEVMPETYTFTGDAITVIGLVGVFSTAFIVISVFRNYWSFSITK